MNKKRTKCNSSPLNSSTPQAIKLKKTSTSIMKSKIEREVSISVNAGKLIKQIEYYFSNDNISNISLFPSFCGSYDSLVCQMISQYGKNCCDSLHQCNDPLISINWRLMEAKSTGRIISEDIDYLEEFMEFHEINFATKKEITNIMLSQLLLWLSWLDNPTDLFNKKNWLNGMVDKLLKILKSKPKDPKSLSTAVACLAYLIVGHPASNSVLTDNNVNQLLKLCLNRSVHPDNIEIGLLEWDVIISRLGLRKLLEIPKVRSGKATNTEIMSFVLKWWNRLVDAANYFTSNSISSSHGQTSDILSTQKSMMNTTIYGVPGSNTHKPGVPCLRAALEVMTDIFERVDTVRDSLINVIMAEGGSGLAFISVYLNSEDYNTAVSASLLFLQILDHLHQRFQNNRLHSELPLTTTTTTTTISTSTSTDILINSVEDISLKLQFTNILDQVLCRLDYFNHMLKNIPVELLDSSTSTTESTAIRNNNNNSKSSRSNRRQTRRFPTEQDVTTTTSDDDAAASNHGNSNASVATYVVTVPVIEALVKVLQAINIYNLSNNNNDLKPIQCLLPDTHTVNILGGTLEILFKNHSMQTKRTKDLIPDHRLQNCETISYLLVLIYTMSEKNSNKRSSLHNDSEEKENNSNYSNTQSPTVVTSEKHIINNVITQLLRNLFQIFPSTYLLLTSTLEYMEIQVNDRSNLTDHQLPPPPLLDVSYQKSLMNSNEWQCVINYYKAILMNLTERRSDISKTMEVVISPAHIEQNIMSTTPESPIIESVVNEDKATSQLSPEIPSQPHHFHSSNNNGDTINQYHDDDNDDDDTSNNINEVTISPATMLPPSVSHFVTQSSAPSLNFDAMNVHTAMPPDDANSTITATSAVTNGQSVCENDGHNLESVSCEEIPEENQSIELLQQVVRDETVDGIESPVIIDDNRNGSTSVSVSPNCNKVISRSTPILTEEPPGEQINSHFSGSAYSEETVTPDSQRIVVTPMSVEEEDDDGNEYDRVEVDRRMSTDFTGYSSHRRSYPYGGPFSDNTIWRKAREDKFGMDSEYDAIGSDLMLLDRRLDFDTHDHDLKLMPLELLSKTHELQQYKFQFLDDEVTGLLQSDIAPAHRLLLVRLRDYHSAAVTDTKKWKVKYERLVMDHECLRGEYKVVTSASSHSELKALTLAAQVEELKGKCNQLSEQLQQTSAELIKETERKKDADTRARKQEELLQEAWLKLQAVSRAEAASRLQVTEANARATALTEKVQILSAERNEVDLLLAEANVGLLQTQTNYLNLQSKEELNSSKLRQAKDLIQELHYEKLSLIDRIENIDSSYNNESKLLEESLQKGIEKDDIIYQYREEIKDNQANIEKLKLELIDLHRVFEEEKSTNRALNIALEKEKSIHKDTEVKLQASQENVTNLQMQLTEKVATITTLSTEIQQKCLQVTELSVSLEQQQQRGDALDVEINKHKELIGFINKISAETEAKKNFGAETEAKKILGAETEAKKILE